MAWFPFRVRFLQAPVRNAITGAIQQRCGRDCDLRHTPNAGHSASYGRLTLSPHCGAAVLGATAERHQSEAAETDGHECFLNRRR